MKSATRALPGLVVLVLAGAASAAQDPAPAPAPAPLERVATGFGFVEGPAWDPIEQHLLFSDIRNDRIMQLGAKGRVTVFLTPAERANGLVFDRGGDLYACLGGARQVVRIDPAGKRTVLAAEYQGKKLNSPNDLALDDAGGLYFTDPRYGKADDLEQEVMGVYYVAGDGKVTRVIGDLGRPNGIVLTPDGSGLYVAVPDAREIHYYPILEPGRLGKGRMIFRSEAKLDGHGPDGMVVDTQGRIYATYRNLLVLSGTGTLRRRIPVPEVPANVTIGGPDGKTLYVTARTSLYRMPLDAGGAAAFVEPSWIGRRMLRLPEFETHEIDGEIGIGYGVAVADVNGDARPDIVLVDRGEVAWYENPDGGKTQPWPKHVIARKLTVRDHVCIAARDIDGDGKAEIAVGAGWNPGDTEHSGSVHVLLPPDDRTRPWQPVALPHQPTVHRMRWVRNDAGGFDLAVLPLHGRGNTVAGDTGSNTGSNVGSPAGKGAAVKMSVHRPPAGWPGKGRDEPWQSVAVDTGLHATHNFDVVQWRPAGSEEFLLAGREGVFACARSHAPYLTRREPTWVFVPFQQIAGAEEGDARFRGASEVRLAYAPDAGSLIATIEPLHGNQLVVYSPVRPGTPRKLWRRRVVCDDLVQGHALACADLNGDRSPEIVVGWRGSPGKAHHGIRIYLAHNARGERVTMIPVDDGIACEDLCLADLDGDGHPDIVAAGRATHNLRIYLNRTFR